MNPAYMLLAIPVFFLAMGIEWAYGYSKKQNWYRLNDSVNNILVGLGQQLWSLVTKTMVFGLYVWIYQNYSFYKISATWWSFVLCLVLFDFLFYWAHRWGHEMNIFWGAHAVHHQSEEYNLSVALRQSWFHNMLAFVIFLPIPFLGFDPLTFGVAAIAQTLYQFWIHTKAVDRMPAWFEYIFNTPSHHRVHHAINPEYIDRNHAGVFMVWDRMFGTFVQEKNDTEIFYGTTTQLKSWNPAWANVEYYVTLFEKAKKMLWTDRLKLIFARPGWMPAYLGGSVPVQPVDKAAYHKYDMDTNIYFKSYAIIQFFITLVTAIMYMANYATISTFYRVVFFLLIFITMLITGAIFENKKWVIYAEYARLVLVMVSLNTFYYFWYINWFNFTIAVSAFTFVGCVAFFTYSYVISTKRQHAFV